jgi:hypothetical protein
VDPEFVFVTGWNEWSAGRQTMGENVSEQLQKWKFYPGAHLGKVGEELEPGDVYFIDQYNQEYSRDIEPMKGGHSDNYYYQLMANIRRYKGMQPPVKAGKPQSIDISGNFNQWDAVENVYYDHKGDTAHRKSQIQGSAGPYINVQGRNDFLESRITYDDQNFYFYVKTADEISRPSGENWMVLLIDSDQNKETGWEGYDFMLNGDIVISTETSVKKYDLKNGWVEVRKVPLKTLDNMMMLSVPKDVFNQ